MTMHRITAVLVKNNGIVTDRTKYIYNANDTISMKNSKGEVRTYDTTSTLVQIQFANGNTYTYSETKDGIHLQNIDETLANEAVQEYYFTKDWTLQKTILHDGTAFLYNANGNIIEQRNKDNHRIQSYEYDEKGDLVKTTLTQARLTLLNNVEENTSFFINQLQKIEKESFAIQGDIAGKVQSSYHQIYQ